MTKIDMGVKALVLKEGKFLVMHNNGVEEDLWELPGGRIEFGETAEETLKREMLEVRLSDEHDAYKWIGTDLESLQMMYNVFRLKMVKWNWNEIKEIL